MGGAGAGEVIGAGEGTVEAGVAGAVASSVHDHREGRLRSTAEGADEEGEEEGGADDGERRGEGEVEGEADDDADDDAFSALVALSPTASSPRRRKGRLQQKQQGQQQQGQQQGKAYQRAHNPTDALPSPTSPLAAPVPAPTASNHANATMRPRGNSNCPAALSTFLDREHAQGTYHDYDDYDDDYDGEYRDDDEVGGRVLTGRRGGPRTRRDSSGGTGRRRRRYLCFNLSDRPADRRTLLLLGGQLLEFDWTPSPAYREEEEQDDHEEDDDDHDNDDDATMMTTGGGGNKNRRRRRRPPLRTPSAPSIPVVLDVCRALVSYLSLPPQRQRRPRQRQRLACVYCADGHSRTGVAIAAYLRASGAVNTCAEGYRVFMDSRDRRGQRRNMPHSSSPPPPPPSLIRFFKNLDDVMDMGGYRNPEPPLILRAVTMQGVPVDDMPRLDVWDGLGGHVFGSHHRRSCRHQTLTPNTARWSDEEGFYRVNAPLRSDFVLLCSFGPTGTTTTSDAEEGEETEEEEECDPTRVLFRYADHASFLRPGPYELPKSKVDVMRRYSDAFLDDFLVTLLFDRPTTTTATTTTTTLTTDIMGERDPIAFLRAGWDVIAERHALSAETAHEALPKLRAMDDDDRRLEFVDDGALVLALRLCDGDLDDAAETASAIGGMLRMRGEGRDAETKKTTTGRAPQDPPPRETEGGGRYDASDDGPLVDPVRFDSVS